LFSFVSTQAAKRPNFRQRRVVAVTAGHRYAKIAPVALHCVMWAFAATKPAIGKRIGRSTASPLRRAFMPAMPLLAQA